MFYCILSVLLVTSLINKANETMRKRLIISMNLVLMLNAKLCLSVFALSTVYIRSEGAEMDRVYFVIKLSLHTPETMRTLDNPTGCQVPKGRMVQMGYYGTFSIFQTKLNCTVRNAAQDDLFNSLRPVVVQVLTLLDSVV